MSDINQTMASRRHIREQGQKLDQAADAVQGMMSPIMQMWATWLNLMGESFIATANTVDRWSDNNHSPRG